MHELLTAENIDYIERAREVAEKYVRPRAAELDQSREYGWDILEALKSYELTGAWIPKEYGGHDAGVLNLCLIVEQLSRACGGVGVAFDVAAAVHPILFRLRVEFDDRFRHFQIMLFQIAVIALILSDIAVVPRPVPFKSDRIGGFP